MSESERIDDAELAALERRLVEVTLPLPNDDRNRLLYACGRAAGLAEARRSIRCWTATAAAVGLLAGGLLVAALGDGTSASRVQDLSTSKQAIPPVTNTESKTSTVSIESQSVAHRRQPAPGVQTLPRDEPRKLKVGMGLNEALALLESQPTPVEPDGTLPEPTPWRPLRAYSVEFQ